MALHQQKRIVWACVTAAPAYVDLTLLVGGFVFSFSQAGWLPGAVVDGVERVQLSFCAVSSGDGAA